MGRIRGVWGPVRRKSPNRLVEWLADRAFMDGYMVGCPTATNVKLSLRDGKPIPERHLPGRLIMGLPPEVREKIKALRAEHFQHRYNGP